jgi:peroxiredoxin Q/BCP
MGGPPIWGAVLALGDLAPEFEGVTGDGQRLTLSSLRGAPVVVFFYPKASSPGCTRESLGFATIYPDLERRGVKVVGVSVDDREEQRRFAENCALPFPLVADRGKEIARAFGVLGAFGLARRVTFVLDAAGRVQDVVDAFLPGPHVTRVKGMLLGGTAP